MKRWILYALAFAVVSVFGASPFYGTDIGELAPVEIVWLTQENGNVGVLTDTGDWGWGADVPSALGNLKATALGTVFLETADYLIVRRGSEKLLEQVYHILRPSCMICVAKEMPDMEQVSGFLRAHEPEITLRQYQNEALELPSLTLENGRYLWSEQ